MIVREDLPRATQVVQAVHAAGESSPGNLSPGTNAIALSVPDEPALRREANRLELAGFRIVRIEEPDPPYHGALMAVGVRPGRKEDLRRHLSSLRLLR